jgi:AcrR family transcriptional regulator
VNEAGTVASQPAVSAPPGPPAPPARRDAVRNYHRILEAARDVLGESGADASMEEIANRAGVGVGTVYRRFANKEALIDELVRLSYDEVQDASRRALAAPGGTGLELFLRGLGSLFAAHAKYAHLLLQRSSNSSAAAAQVRAVLEELTVRALAAGTLNPGVTLADVMALIWAIRGITETAGGVAPGAWQRFLDIHLSGLCAPGPLSDAPPLSAQQLAELLPRG